MLYEALIVSLIVWLTVGGQELLGLTQLGRPIVIGPLVGLALGDLQTGLLLGASLETIFMGVVNIGGASSAEPGLASALAVAFAIKMHGGLGVALPIAIPIGIIGLQIKTLIYVAIVGPFASKFDHLAAEGNQKGIVGLHYGLWTLQWFIYSLIPFFAIMFGSQATQDVLNMIPSVITNGLTIAGNLLPAVGMAMLMKILWENDISVYYFLGFLIVAYFKVPLIAVAVMAIVIGVVNGQRDFQLHQLDKKLSERPSVVTTGTSDSIGHEPVEDADDTDFFS
ncbi:PTS mannose/fructose/sorbose/N-acetylgalactosamine transporter subunit IIC [Lactiplantibacillus plantarum]|uniref:PTS system mannose-specific IIC component n=1 Tax=Lactiplantibacillus plantarum WJL TaxID=1350466 RepID=A0A837PAA8_LACPN|nr:PTS sugar transporter subunit IIC [Lactiplantibacillus plantarum]ERO40012.1 PTS system sorbose-specific transporter subunit IIC [Lactiplantibacillus plantarum WJL]KPN44579.1 PTS system mannose-specific IIC component [Lactiplantibacillus plantarum WJL]MBF9193528.1 PTS sugar transporter subunit IIC [Lactiplantibacillus plantarum]MBU7472275.1 PTS sugar transporter subunit IIC [Lactiplantibacillus plantarum]MDO8176485.1 PTS sugar transporter subunit IIC [Lactiplantibacillus plantarum]